MRAPTHVSLGVAATVAACHLAPLGFRPVDFLAVVLGSLLPDIDSSRGTVARPGDFVRPFVSWRMRRILNDVGRVLATLLNKVAGHRSITHWPLWGLVLMALGYWLSSPWLMWLGWGYLWHLIGDFCTIEGIPLFAPFSRSKVRWSPMRTGSWWEVVIAVVLVVFVIVAGFPLLPLHLRQSLAEVGRFALDLVEAGLR